MKKQTIKKNYTSVPADFTKAINEKKEFHILFHVFSSDTETVLTKIIHRYLEVYDILYMKNTMISIVKEIVNNAVKANLKRLYFRVKGLDIFSPEDYEKGMASFKIESYQTKDTAIFDKLQKSEFTVKVRFNVTEEHIEIYIINNIPILDGELKKVNARIIRAYEYKDMSEAFEDTLDDTEGAGLGLIMAMMLFKNSGLPASTLAISRNGDETSAAIKIPKRMIKAGTRSRIAKELLDEINDIPSLPDNIKKIQELCLIPEPPIEQIIETIVHDPALTASILKLSNSGSYVTANTISSIHEAVGVIGIKGINTLLVASGVTKIISAKYRKYEILWKRSNKRAFYSRKLALHYNYADITESAFLAGLLADIGSIIFLSIDQHMIQELKKIAGFKGIENSDLLEEISLGISHGSLGAMICERWKFDDALVKAVEFHHRPQLSPKNYKQLIFIVHLAEVFLDIEEHKTRFEIVDDSVLDFFNISKKNNFESLHMTIQKEYA